MHIIDAYIIMKKLHFRPSLWALPWALGPRPSPGVGPCGDRALPWALVGPCGDQALRGPGP